MAAASRTLINKGAQNILLSLGADGAVISNGVKTFHAKCDRKTTVVNTVGAGDTMLAAAADIILKGGNIQEILRHAVAAGASKVSSINPYLSDAEYVKEYLPKVQVEEIV